MRLFDRQGGLLVLRVGCAIALLAGCGSGGGDGAMGAGTNDAAVPALTVASEARSVEFVDGVRDRFQVLAGAATLDEEVAVSAIPAAQAARFEEVDGRIVARFDGARTRGGRTAELSLPIRADGVMHLADPVSGVAVDVRLEGARAVAAEAAGGYVAYRGAHAGGGDVIHRPGRDGTEDFFHFVAAPAVNRIDYRVSLSAAVAGLRHVGGAIELLDVEGAPRIRIAAPWAIDAGGRMIAVTLVLAGCDADESPAAPWGRATVAPGAAECGVSVRWGAADYPLLVDPSWVFTGSMSIQHASHSATLLAGGKVLVAGGITTNNVITPVAELYDPQTKMWAVTGPLFAARYQHTANLLGNNKVLVCGGSPKVNNSMGLSSCELYDANKGLFAPAGTMKVARFGHTSSLLGSGKVLAAGGADEQGVISATAELYDAGGDAWALTGSMTDRRYLQTGSVLGSGKVIVAGGVTLAGDSKLCELYDPQTAKWTATGAMGTGRHGQTETTLGNGQVLVAGGRGGNLFLDAAELYDPQKGTWGATANNLTAKRLFHSQVLLGNGRVLVTGGFNGAALSSAEVFDSGTGMFTATVAMKALRLNHTTTLLGSGLVLAAGGTDETAELYLSQEADGIACADGANCKSTFCVDGVCCENACAGQCASCNAPNKAGLCTPIAGAPAGGRKACNSDGGNCAGKCDGIDAMACVYPGNMINCRAAGCANGVATAAANCNGTGVCPAPQTTMCAPYLCGNGACRNDCNADADCVKGSYCVKGKCTLRNLGDPCMGGGECASTFCVDSVCCENACAGQCAWCNAPNKAGVCGTAPAGAPVGGRMACANDGTSCGGRCDGNNAMGCAYPDNFVSCRVAGCTSDVATAAANCDGMGACPAPQMTVCAPYLCANGACRNSCNNDADCKQGSFCVNGKCTLRNLGDPCVVGGECASTFCADSVCCESACAGQCAACNLMNSAGMCRPVKGAPAGMRTPCASDGSACGGSCDGTNPGACAFADGKTVCRMPSCAACVATLPAVCDGKGGCPAATMMACVPFACGTTDCLAKCTQDTDCFGGNYCNAQGGCVPPLRPGLPCSDGRQCERGFCADGVCCDWKCSEQCAACNLPGKVGICSLVTGAPVGGRAACTGTGQTCGGACDGVTPLACAYPGKNTPCAPAKCDANMASAAAMCDGVGACAPGAVTSCSAGCDGTACAVTTDMAPANGTTGGGCAVGGGDARGGAPLIVALALLARLLGRKRRRSLAEGRGR